MFMHAMILSHITYCVIISGQASQSVVKPAMSLYKQIILCKSLARDEGCNLALCYLPYIPGIGCLCVTIPNVLSLLNKTHKNYVICWNATHP